MSSGPGQRGTTGYLDFEVEVGEGRADGYPLAVLRSPEGEARDTLRLPYAPAALDARLAALQEALRGPARGPAGERRVIPQAGSPVRRAPAAREFGQALFEALLPGRLGRLYDLSRRAAEGQGRGLRLRLRVLDPVLAALPWELLYDPSQDEYLCRMAATPVVRHVEAERPIPGTLRAPPPLRVLGMVATPTDQPSLGVAQERGWIDLAVRELPPGAPPVHVEWLGGQTWRALRDALRAGQGPWHVFHFVGHGGFDPAGGDEGSGEGYLALTDEASGGTYRLPADELGRLLRQQRELRLVVLNACEGARGSERELFSGTAATLVRMGVPAVVAMQHRISDRAATEFARTFYGELTRGLPVDAAAAEARAAMALASPGTQEWATPVLYLRAPDAVLFDFDLGAAPSAGEATVPAPRPAGAPGADGIPVAQKVPRTLDPAFTTLLLYIICFLYTFSYSYIIKEYYFIEDIFLVILFVGCILIGMFYSSMFLDNLNSIYKSHIAKLLFSMTIFVFSSFSYFIVLYIQLLLPHRTFGFVDLYLGIFGSYTYRVDVLTTPFFLFSMVLSLCSTIPIYIISRTGYPIGRILRSLFSL